MFGCLAVTVSMLLLLQLSHIDPQKAKIFRASMFRNDISSKGKSSRKEPLSGGGSSSDSESMSDGDSDDSLSHMFWMNAKGLTTHMSKLLHNKFGSVSHWSSHDTVEDSDRVMDKFVFCTGYRYHGDDLRFFTLKKVEECAEECIKDANCEVFEFSVDNCITKFRGKLPVGADNAQSYVKIGTSANVCPNLDKPTNVAPDINEIKGPILSFEWNEGKMFSNLYTLNNVARLAMALDLPLFIPFASHSGAWLGLEECRFAFCAWSVSKAMKKLVFFTEQDVEEQVEGGMEKLSVLSQMNSLSVRVANAQNKIEEGFYATECFVRDISDNENPVKAISKLKSKCSLILLNTRYEKFQQKGLFSSENNDIFTFLDAFRPSDFLMNTARTFLEETTTLGLAMSASVHVKSSENCKNDNGQDRTIEGCLNTQQKCREEVKRKIDTLANRDLINSKDQKKLLHEHMLMCSLFPKKLSTLASSNQKLALVAKQLEKNLADVPSCNQSKACGCSITQDLDFADGNLRNAPVTEGPEGCCMLCREEHKCVGAVFFENVCWLKSDVSKTLNVSKRVGIVIDQAFRGYNLPAFLLSSDREFARLTSELKSAGGIPIETTPIHRIAWGPQLAAYQREINRFTQTPIKDRFVPNLDDVRNLYNLIFEAAVHIQSDFYIGSPWSESTPATCLWRGDQRLDDSTICRSTLQFEHCFDKTNCPIFKG